MTTTHAVVAPLAVAFITAVATLAGRAQPSVRRTASTLGVFAYAAAVAYLDYAVLTGDGSVLAYQVGGWVAPYGISFVADPLSAFFLTLTALVAVPSLLFALRDLDGYGDQFFHPLYAFLLVGVTGGFLTGDLFNLFVWFEVTLLASYALVAFRSTGKETLAATRYLVVNLVGSALMLVSIGGLYGVTGTLNIADVARRVADPAAYNVDPVPVLGLALLLISVFALKAGLVPLHWWVPSVYDAAPPAAAALLSGVVKKVGVYAILRLSFTVLQGSAIPVPVRLFGLSTPLDVVGVVLLVMAAGSVLLGGLTAVDRPSLAGTFAYSSIGQLGFIVVPLGIAAIEPSVRTLALTAALAYALAHGLAKALLFLVSGTISDATGTTRLSDIGGLAGRSPLLAGAFLVGVLSLVGVPPLVGFFAKFAVFRVAATSSLAALAVVIVGALLTIAYATRTWNRVFWGARTPAVADADVDRYLLACCLGLALVVVAAGVGYDPVLQFTQHAANAATPAGRDAYIAGVFGGESA
ncbi:complex I subunit 5 family protein [Halocalculus aciditolerans]|uniref:Cation:proton antiporter n=1 Tax=Halocalculus aciditolerans TaxID=1383812 RepID=A0A830FKY6_9EURY|nr:proton-conducting transporter membrane subunit [Halocalculus aciditolerans]GGL56597.1 cation:proton antiporter [Halocalculus aciditolerans]